MRRLKTFEDTSTVSDMQMRQLIRQRFAELSEMEDFTFDELAEFWLIEPGDTVEAAEAATGVPIASSWFSEARYGEDDFSPSWEVLEAHPSCYEMVFVTSDSGYGTVVWIPKTEVAPMLLRLCAEHATPAPLSPAPVRL